MSMAMMFGLLGGLGLFLYGMQQMGDGLQKAAGHKMRRLLEVLTSNRLLGVFVGAAVTAIIQSSSATTVMVVGFVNAGLMSLHQAIGVIMGANVGTTVTAQLIAFDIGAYALVFVAIGVLPIVFSKRKRWRYMGQVLAGFGILFLGIETMKTALAPIAETPSFASITRILAENQTLGLGLGAALTALLQSSSAAIGIIQSLALEGGISVQMALPILFGTNVGTTITALLSSVGTSLNARRAAVSHLCFNLIGTIIFLPLLPWFAKVVARTSQSPVRQIANAHTLFNAANTIILLPFAGLLAVTVVRLVPGKPETNGFVLHLDRRLLQTPAIALEQVFKEVMQMGEIALEMLTIARDNLIHPDEEALERMLELEETIDGFEAGIAEYLVEISRGSLSDKQADMHRQLHHLINDIERVGDHGENIEELLAHNLANHISFSDRAMEELSEFLDYTVETFKVALRAWENDDPMQARLVEDREQYIDIREEQLRHSHIERLTENLCSPASGVVFLDIISNLERIGDHSANIAGNYLGEMVH
ncbi:MAG: Na/Pi cotransporter family protein [Firmicutes bacterium]|nr:Na/Pi cotransporter family protein [Bacillota bacterium]